MPRIGPGYQGRSQGGRRPKVFWAPSEGMWAVESPYDAAFVPRLKLAAGPSKRWNAPLKVWLVDDAHIEDVKRILREQFGAFDFVDKGPPQSVASCNNKAFERFVRLIGLDAANIAYKRTMASLHPDVGGDAAAAADLNAAWQEIRPLLEGPKR